LDPGEKINKLVLATIIFVVAVGAVGGVGEAVKTIDVRVYEDPPLLLDITSVKVVFERRIVSMFRS